MCNSKVKMAVTTYVIFYLNVFESHQHKGMAITDKRSIFFSLSYIQTFRKSSHFGFADQLECT